MLPVVYLVINLLHVSNDVFASDVFKVCLKHPGQAVMLLSSAFSLIHKAQIQLRRCPVGDNEEFWVKAQH